MKKDAARNARADTSRPLTGEMHPVPSCRRVVPSEDLLGDDGSLLIDHNGRLYLLRSLPGGRLILTGWRAGLPELPGIGSSLR